MNAAQSNLAGNLAMANMVQRGGMGLSGMFANQANPYTQAQQQMSLFGNNNVYGYGGQGTVPNTVSYWGDF